MTDAEIVRAAAEKVMGYLQWGDNSPRPEVIPYFHMPRFGEGAILHWANGSSQDWNPLASDADAFMLVDKLTTTQREFTLERGNMLEFGGMAWYANFDDAGIGRSLDRRRAIVLACLKAQGVEEQEDQG